MAEIRRFMALQRAPFATWCITLHAVQCPVSATLQRGGWVIDYVYTLPALHVAQVHGACCVVLVGCWGWRIFAAVVEAKSGLGSAPCNLGRLVLSGVAQDDACTFDCGALMENFLLALILVVLVYQTARMD